MDPPEPIHGVIGVDRALGLRVTVRKLALFLLGGRSQPQHKHKREKKTPLCGVNEKMNKNKQPNNSDSIQILFTPSFGKWE